MIAKDLRDRINSICTHVLFDYNGKECGVDPFNEKHFDMWYGDNAITVTSIDDVMKQPFFDGQSLPDIADEIETD